MIAVFLVIYALTCAQSTLADCNYPQIKFAIPYGSTATMEDMVAAQTSFKAYNTDMDTYLKCLDDELAKISEDLDIYPDIKKASDLKYDAAVDVLTQAAEEWNQAVRDYKAQ